MPCFLAKLLFILAKCKALEIILIGLFLAGDVESFIIFPCSWYNFAASLLFGLCVSHSFSRSLIPWNAESRIGALDSKKIVVKGGKKDCFQ